MPNYEELSVWKKAHEIVVDVYRTTVVFPRQERYGLQAQMRRASVSIPSNIVEGAGRGTDKDFARFVSHAIGSANELEYQLLVALELGYLEPSSFGHIKDRIVEVRKMLLSLRDHLIRADSRLEARDS